jgi:hypothetical protein
MESISIRQRLRPVRYCFIVNSDDRDGFIRAAALNTVLWGGMYNPIVSGTGDLEAYIREFDPDYLVNLTDADLPQAITTSFQFRVHRADRPAA